MKLIYTKSCVSKPPRDFRGICMCAVGVVIEILVCKGKKICVECEDKKCGKNARWEGEKVLW